MASIRLTRSKADPDEIASVTPLRPDAQDPRPLVAAARRVKLDDRKAMKYETRKAPWQSRAMDAVEQVGELGHAVDFCGDMASRLVLFPAVEIGDDTESKRVPLAALQKARAEAKAGREPLTPEMEEAAFVSDQLIADAIANWRLFRSRFGGQSELQRRMNGNLEGPGECWVYGYEDDEGRNYEILSIDEVFIKDERYRVKRHRGDMDGVEVDEKATLWKVWIPDYRYHNEANSHLRRLLDDAELLGILTGQIKAESRSRHVAGILTWPNELSYGPPDPTSGEGGAENHVDQSILDLEDAILAPATDPNDPGTVMPTIVRGPKEVLEAIRHIQLGRPVDAALDTRIDNRIKRLAMGANLPVETMLGHQQTTFANAGQVDEDTYTKYFDPRARLMVQAFTYGYLIPALRSLGYSAEELDRLLVWFDPTALIAQPDPTEHADEAHKNLAISNAAYRRVTGFGEDDAPSPMEVMERLMMTAGQGPGGNEMLGAFMQMFAQANGLTVPELPKTPEPLPPGPMVEQVLPEPIEAVVVSSARTRPLGERLASIDVELRTRLLTSASAAMSRALEKAGNKAKTKAKGDMRAMAAAVPAEDVTRTLGAGGLTAAGLSTEDLLPDDSFDALEASFRSWVESAGDDALAAVSQQVSGFTKPSRERAKLRILSNIDEAWSWLKNALLAAGKVALFGPDTPADGEWDPTLRVKPGLIREALARAGGTTLEVLGDSVFVAVGGRPPPGVATGDVVMEAFRDLGGLVEGYVWDYGAAPRQHPFDPHVAMDGVVFRDFNDEVLAYAGWPDFGYLFPGDHDGCVCDANPVMVLPSEVGG